MPLPLLGKRIIFSPGFSPRGFFAFFCVKNSIPNQGEAMEIDIVEIAQAMLAFVFSVAVISAYIFIIAATLLLMAHRMPWAI
jgi:hypothetical protein